MEICFWGRGYFLAHKGNKWWLSFRNQSRFLNLSTLTFGAGSSSVMGTALHGPEYFCSIRGPHPLNASSTPQLWQPKISPDQVAPVENHPSRRYELEVDIWVLKRGRGNKEAVSSLISMSPPFARPCVSCQNVLLCWSMTLQQLEALGNKLNSFNPITTGLSLDSGAWDVLK